jgi:hypothetical protein
MRFHVIQDQLGKITVRTRVYKTDQVLYTCPVLSRAETYAAYLQGSRCYSPEGTRAVDRKGREITIPVSA